MEHVWQRIQSVLQQSLNPGLFKVWITPLEAALTGDSLEIAAPNEFVAAWVRDRLLGAISQAAAQVLGHTPSVTVSACLQPKPAQAADRASSSAPASVTTPGLAPLAPPIPQASAKPEARPRQEHLGLPMVPKARIISAKNWRFSFNDFVVGPCNELAFAASTGLCRDTLASDQLFLSSSPGLGKTHLLQAIGRDLADASNRKNLRIAYLTAEEFASQLVMAIKAREVEAFKAQFRDGVDLMLLEDIHFLQGKEKMQDELLATLKALRERGAKVVFTSSFLPRELSDMDSRLLSRMTGGFMTVIDKPDFTTRMRIVEQKARNRFHMVIPGEVSELLAERIKTDIRQLESCLQNMVLKAQLLGRAINMDLAWDVLQTYGVEAVQPNIDRILDFVCRCYETSSDQLRSKSRKREIVLARNTAFYLARKHTGLSLKDIGNRFNRTHSTVLKGITNVEVEMRKNTPLGRQIQKTIERLEA